MIGRMDNNTRLVDINRNDTDGAGVGRVIIVEKVPVKAMEIAGASKSLKQVFESHLFHNVLKK